MIKLARAQPQHFILQHESGQSSKVPVICGVAGNGNQLQAKIMVVVAGPQQLIEQFKRLSGIAKPSRQRIAQIGVERGSSKIFHHLRFPPRS